MFGKSLIGVHEIKSLREFEAQCHSEEGKQEGKGNGCYTVFLFLHAVKVQNEIFGCFHFSCDDLRNFKTLSHG